MKIAVLSDIHGNANALGRTLTEVGRLGVDRLLILGDLVGYYYDAAKVLELLSDWTIDVIRGNHERWLAESIANPAIAESYRTRYGSALDVARSTLSADQIERLIALPDQLTVGYEGMTFELCHGSPRSPDQYIYPDSDQQTLDNCRVAGRDFVLMGHTHYPFLDATKPCLLLNPGSVGQPRDHGRLASWCCIDVTKRTVNFRSTPFDYEAVAAEARMRDPEIPYLSDVLERVSDRQRSVACVSF